MKKLLGIVSVAIFTLVVMAPSTSRAQGPYYPGYESGISFGSDGYNYITSRSYTRDNYNYNRGNYYSQGSYNNQYYKPTQRSSRVRQYQPDRGSYYYRGTNPGRYDSNLYSGTWDRGGGISQAYRY